MRVLDRRTTEMNSKNWKVPTRSHAVRPNALDHLPPDLLIDVLVGRTKFDTPERRDKWRMMILENVTPKLLRPTWRMGSSEKCSKLSLKRPKVWFSGTRRAILCLTLINQTRSRVCVVLRPSINNLIECSGPDLNNFLDMLLRFRSSPVA